MFPLWLKNHTSFKNSFKLVCFSLTLLLIYQESVKFSVTKPTTTSTEEKDLETSDLPEVVFCPVPGFDDAVIYKNGYYNSEYYRGLVWLRNGQRFVGWNGICRGSRNDSSKSPRNKSFNEICRTDQNRSSNEILEEILTIDSQLINAQGKLVPTVHHYAEGNPRETQGVPATVKPRILAYPYGRCMSVIPPSQNDTNHSIPNTLHLRWERSPVSENETLRLFFMSQANSLKLYPNEMETLGDPIEIKREDSDAQMTTYKTKISRNQHVEGDPRFKCRGYTIDDSYNDCIQNELLDAFDQEIKCQPPLLVKDPTRICNKRFNIKDNTTVERIRKLFNNLYYHDFNYGDRCRVPCLTNVYNTRFVHKAKKKKATILAITFDNTVEVFQSSFSIDEQTFLTRLGGSVSSGRTLLWISLTLLGVVQVSSLCCWLF